MEAVKRARAQLRARLRRGGVRGRLDPWLELFDDRLGPLDAACAGAGPEAFALFRELDDLWRTLLLSREYEGYSGILSLLPEMPDPAHQLTWTGAQGLDTLARAKPLYARIRAAFERPRGGLERAAVLDFGCGWGRLTRCFARDVEPGFLFGCDPVPEILDVCRRDGGPREFALSEPAPERLPFERSFDLVFASSAFTHLSEAAHLACLRAIHEGLSPLRDALRRGGTQPRLRARALG